MGASRMEQGTEAEEERLSGSETVVNKKMLRRDRPTEHFFRKIMTEKRLQKYGFCKKHTFC